MEACIECGTIEGYVRRDGICHQCYCAKQSNKIVCEICGKLEVPSVYNSEYALKLKSYNLCFTCNFWREQLTERDNNTAIIDGVHYHIGVEHPEGYKGFKGYGEAFFIIEFFDGRKIETHNLWCQGEIPKYILELGFFNNNAKFLNRGYSKVGPPYI